MVSGLSDWLTHTVRSKLECFWKKYMLTPNEHIGDLNQKIGPEEFRFMEEDHFWGVQIWAFDSWSFESLQWFL